MKKVLIITYYWPPMGGGGVQRWLKTTKYLREFGWEPIIFTPENGEIAILDDEMVLEIPPGIEVIRTPIWEPFEIYKKISGKKTEDKLIPGVNKDSSGSSLVQKFTVWIRGNIFIPDARKFWIKPASKILINYLKRNKIDAIISTGPPHSMHLIALNAIKKVPTPWLADFRDPWTNIDFYHQLMLSERSNKKHQRLEKEVLNEASEVVTVSWSWASDFEKISGRKPIVITNGYDPADFVEAGKVKLDEKFTITHAGSLNDDRNPHSFWKALEQLCLENLEFKNNLEIKLIGQIAPSVNNSIQKHNLKGNLNHLGNLPHHKVVSHLIKSQLLLLPLNDSPNIDGVIPGKLYEYIGSKRPIICIGKPDGDSGKIVKETNAGTIADFGATDHIKNILHSYYNAYKQNSLHAPITGYEKYSRKELAGKIAEQLNQITEF